MAENDKNMNCRVQTKKGGKRATTFGEKENRRIGRSIDFRVRKMKNTGQREILR